MATNPPINHPVLGMNGLITPVWAEFFLKLANNSTLSGYMLKSTYDPTSSGSVVDSDKLGGELPSYYLDLSNHTGSLRIGHVDWNVRITATDITAAVGDLCDVDATAAAVNITLPDPAVNIGKMVAVAKADSSANAVNMIGTVNGVVDPAISVQYTCYMLASNGIEWRRL